MAICVSHGYGYHIDELAKLEQSGRSDPWTLPREAETDDTVAFYIQAPVSSFVATGIVLDDNLIDGRRHGWPGRLMGMVGDVVMLPQEVHLHEVKSAVPDWGWLY